MQDTWRDTAGGRRTNGWGWAVAFVCTWACSSGGQRIDLGSLTHEERTFAIAVAPIEAHTDTVSVLDTNVTNPQKWRGITFAPITNLLYACPYDADAVLIVDPATNLTDTTALTGLGTSSGKWYGLTYAPATNKLYAAPHTSDAVLIVDPTTNQSDISSSLDSGAVFR
eukprot:m.61660 g.61660  ORF g.61660 m.61660 type:complete len:168 (+) comp17594_c0_seq1:97-600(+)